MRSTVWVSRSLIGSCIGYEVFRHGSDSPDREVFCFGHARDDDRTPYVKPILNMGSCRYGQERIKGRRSLAYKGVGIDSKDLVPLGVEELHFGA